MNEDIGQHVVGQVVDLIAAGKVISYGVDIPDNQYSKVLWSQYGLMDTNEIAVLVRCGSKVFGARAPSGLIVPPMADRIWGVDVSDQALAFELGDKLWEAYSQELIQEAGLA